VGPHVAPFSNLSLEAGRPRRGNGRDVFVFASFAEFLCELCSKGFASTARGKIFTAKLAQDSAKTLRNTRPPVFHPQILYEKLMNFLRLFYAAGG
jgi:hypothetical protein